jgi:energy-coupling factor transporter ATP-binding protein EcfA2
MSKKTQKAENILIRPFLSLKGEVPVAKVEASNDFIHVIDPMNNCCPKHDAKSCNARQFDMSTCCKECPEKLRKYNPFGDSYDWEVKTTVMPVLDCEETRNGAEYKRECIYVTGMSGSGKSTWISNYMKSFNKVYPDREIYIISKVHDDPTFKNIQYTHIPIDETWVDDPYTKEDFEESLVVFDDASVIDNKTIGENIEYLKKEILEEGRHNGISCIITSHMAADKNRTRTILNESTKIVVFPRSMSTKSLEYVLGQYYDLTKKQIERIKKLPSRWVLINRDFPKYIIYDGGIYIP